MEKSQKILPTFVYVNGMPIGLRGLNGKYQLQKCGSYIRIENIPHYYLIYVPNSYITKEHGEWRMKIDGRITGSSEDLPFIHVDKGEIPTGEWSGEVLVTTDTNLSTWWRSNKNIFKISAVLGIGIYSRFFYGSLTKTIESILSHPVR